MGFTIERVAADDPAVDWRAYGVPSVPPELPVVALIGEFAPTRQTFVIDHWAPAPSDQELAVLRSSPAREALKTFQRLERRYPGNVYAIKARTHIDRCYKSLSGHELYVGKFYFKTGHYRAALYRFKSVVENYPDVGYHLEALDYIRQCRIFMAEEEG